MHLLVFEKHPSSSKVRCSICDQETGMQRWISRRSARFHVNTQQHQRARNAIQDRLAAQRHNQRMRPAADELTDTRLQAPTSSTISGSCRENVSCPSIYELTDLYCDNNGDEVVFTAGDDFESLEASTTERHNTLMADAEYLSMTGQLGWDDGEEGDTTITNVGEVLSSMGA